MKLRGDGEDGAQDYNRTVQNEQKNSTMDNRATISITNDEKTLSSRGTESKNISENDNAVPPVNSDIQDTNSNDETVNSKKGTPEKSDAVVQEDVEGDNDDVEIVYPSGLQLGLLSFGLCLATFTVALG